MKMRRALLSVSDKTGLVDFARGLTAQGIELFSTGGTAAILAKSGIVTTAVSEYTGAPEILDGRVKTLHPKIHGGLLARPTAEHQAELAAHGIDPIDLLIVNLYPFENTVADTEVTPAKAIENIDIGGPAMLRSAAKNHERVAVIVDPEDYAMVLDEMAQSQGALNEATRFRLACKAFAHTAAYDGSIAAYLSSITTPSAGQRDKASERRVFPGVLTIQWRRAIELRYGENPHQQAAFFADANTPLKSSSRRPSLATAEIIQGKALSYNNLLDIDAALGCCLEFEAPAAVIVKHTNPCGVAASQKGLVAAYHLARATDPTSSFGGIVAVNRDVDEELASLLGETFLECIVAPGYTDAARAALAKKKNLRLLATGPFGARVDDTGWTMRTVAGGILVQSADFALTPARSAQVVSERAPTEEELLSMDFAWRVAKHVKSNAIVFCRGTQTLGIGAGQMSRVDSARIARLKAEAPLQGSVVASDAFFPFRDGIDQLAEAGASAIIQPGGSIRDDEVIAAANEHGLAMLFTGMRHFRH